MTLRAIELSAVCDELASLVGQPVHKIVQPDDEAVLISLRGHWLLVDVSARRGRLHLVGERGAGTGEAAPAFCMLLRKHLTNARLSSLRAIEGERACELAFTDAEGVTSLRVFLFGPAAQLQLVRDDVVLGSIGPARRRYEALPAPHPLAADHKPNRFTAPFSPAIAQHYGELDRRSTVDDARRSAQARLDAEDKKLRRLIAAIERDRQRALDAEGLRKHGDLIFAHLREVPRGAREVTLPDDFVDGAPLTIALDPARSAKDNAERFYKEHKRLSRARAAMERRLDEAIARLDAVRRKREQLSEKTDAEVVVDERVAPKVDAKAKAQERALPYKRFASATGTPILVGRGAAKNDALTWKVARGNDLWLHTRDVPGAHVIVPLEGGRAVDAETLVDAATLAAHHSNARGEAHVDVGYALRKHLRKPKGGAPGAVLVSQQKTVRVRLEAPRLARLLATLT